MGYNLIAHAVDLGRLESLLGSGDEKFLQNLIKEQRENLIAWDEGLEFFEDFEKEILAEYDAYVASDFSYNHPISKADDLDDEPDELSDEEAAIVDSLATGNDAALVDLIGGLFDGAVLNTDSRGAEDPIRELSMGCAICQLVLGRPLDPNMGDRYGWALECIVESISAPLEADCFESLRSSFDWTRELVKSAKEKGVDSPLLSRKSLFLHRDCPIAIPDPESFPAISVLSAGESKQLMTSLERCGVKPLSSDDAKTLDEWGAAALATILEWTRIAAEHHRGIVTFYG